MVNTRSWRQKGEPRRYGPGPAGSIGWPRCRTSSFLGYEHPQQLVFCQRKDHKSNGMCRGRRNARPPSQCRRSLCSLHGVGAGASYHRWLFYPWNWAMCALPRLPRPSGMALPIALLKRPCGGVCSVRQSRRESTTPCLASKFWIWASHPA